MSASSEKTGKKTGLIIGLIVAILLCAGAGVGYFILSDNNSKKVAEMLASIPGTAKAEKISTNIASKSIILSNFSYESPDKTLTVTAPKIIFGGVDASKLSEIGSLQVIEKIIIDQYKIAQTIKDTNTELLIEYDKFAAYDVTADLKEFFKIGLQNSADALTSDDITALFRLGSGLDALPEKLIEKLRKNIEGIDSLRIGRLEFNGSSFTLKEDDAVIVGTIDTLQTKGLTTTSVHDLLVRGYSASISKGDILSLVGSVEEMRAQKIIIPSVSKFLMTEDLNNPKFSNFLQYGILDIAGFTMKNIHLSTASNTHEKETRGIKEISIDVFADGKIVEQNIGIDGIEVAVSDIKNTGISPYYEEIYGKPLYFSLNSKAKASKVDDTRWSVQLQDIGISEPVLGSFSLATDFDFLLEKENDFEKIATSKVTSTIVDKNFFDLAIKLNAAQIAGTTAGPNFDAARVEVREFLNSPQLCGGLDEGAAAVCHNLRQFALYSGTFSLNFASDVPLGLEELVISKEWKSSFTPAVQAETSQEPAQAQEAAQAENVEQPQNTNATKSPAP